MVWVDNGSNESTRDDVGGRMQIEKRAALTSNMGMGFGQNLQAQLCQSPDLPK